MKTYSKRIPRISTRGFYDLGNGRTLSRTSYVVYPKKSFENLIGVQELVIMIHGLRNNKTGALTKFVAAKKRLKKLGYHYPVVGYTYDSNTKGAHIKSTELRALLVGQKIAKKNSTNLSKFILDFKKISPKTKLRLIGHSLGTEVILYTLQKLAEKSNSKGVIESAHFFGSSISSETLSTRKMGKIIQKTVEKKIKNYYSPTDDVLKQSNELGTVKNPIGFNGKISKRIKKFTHKKVFPKNHRFVSYAAVLKSYP